MHADSYAYGEFKDHRECVLLWDSTARFILLKNCAMVIILQWHVDYNKAWGALERIDPQASRQKP